MVIIIIYSIFIIGIIRVEIDINGVDTIFSFGNIIIISGINFSINRVKIKSKIKL